MSYKKILAIKLRALGDTVLMTAPLAELRKAYPQAEIHVTVLSTWAPLLDKFPGIDRVWTYERHKEVAARAKALTRLAFALRRERYDLVINLHASPSSAALSFATGARARSIHFHGHKNKNRYSTFVIEGKGSVKPVIERDMDAIRALGLKITPGAMPSLHPSSTEIHQAKELLSGLRLAGPVLGIGLGASRPTKKWPVDRFATLAVKWCLKKQGCAIALAGPQERDEILSFLKAVDDTLTELVPDPAQRTEIRKKITAQNQFSVRQLAAIIQQLSVFATNDSGPKHVAVAVKTPTVTFFGPEDPFEWHPYPKEMHPYFFVENLPCRKDAMPGMPAWCGLDVCTQENHKCMRMIGTDPVLSECERVAKKVE